jgi:hypothetical protein
MVFRFFSLVVGLCIVVQCANGVSWKGSNGVSWLSWQGSKTAAPTPILRWGHEGHDLVAKVAESLMTKGALGVAKGILGGKMPHEVASWADEIRRYPEWAWSKSLHFFDSTNCTFNLLKDCPDGECVIGAIHNYTERASKTSSPGQDNALKFLIHFVGDVHQPLHCGLAADGGGNAIHVVWTDDKQKNLHEIWDTSVITKSVEDDFAGSEDGFLQSLLGDIQGEWSANITAWENSRPEGWAEESLRYACGVAYRHSGGQWIRSNDTLTEGDYEAFLPVVRLRLAQGGVRLASVLNKIYS